MSLQFVKASTSDALTLRSFLEIFWKQCMMSFLLRRKRNDDDLNLGGSDMGIFLAIDVMMALLFLAIGLLFYRSNGNAANYLAGYNMKTKEEREKHDETEMCKEYGKRMMFMSVPFIVGGAVDYKYAGTGTVIAWGIWIVMFILLLAHRNKREA